MHESNPQANPYQPPSGVDHQDRTKDTAIVGAICFWIAVVCWAVGLISFFVRNSPPLGWFLIAAGLLVAAIVFSRKRYRWMSVIVLVLCILTGTVTTLAHYRHLQALRARQQAVEAAEAAAVAEYEAIMRRAEPTQ